MDSIHPDPWDRDPEPGLALALGGGGARAAYQAGVLGAIAEAEPGLEIPILSGVSAGAITAAFLANHTGTFREKVETLTRLWLTLDSSRVFRTDVLSLASRAAAMATGLGSGAPVHGMVDASPLRSTLREIYGTAGDDVLPGVATNLDSGRLRAVAITSTCYSTGQTITFFSGRHIEAWERPQRKSVNVELTVDHVMASTALPLVFPSVPIDDLHYGDGGIRLVAPLATAVHLGAERILAISTRHQRSRAEADRPIFTGPPSPAQVIGLLYNAIFLDALDQDAMTMERVNDLVRRIPPAERGALREVKLLVLRPSRDLGALASPFEPRLPSTFRFLTRRLGTRRARTQDFLSTLMFQHEYLHRLYDLGRGDGERRLEEIRELLRP